MTERQRRAKNEGPSQRQRRAKKGEPSQEEPSQKYLPKVSIKAVEVYEKLTNLFRRFINFKDQSLYGLSAIYVILTYLYEIFDQIPYLQIFGRKGSGKSRLGDLFEQLCFNPLNSSEISDASLYRAIGQESEGMTMIIDEADDLSGSTHRGCLLKVLKSGYRRNGTVIRSRLGGGIERFSTFCPKVIINERGIQNPALDSRTITIHMIKSGHTLEKFQFSIVEKEFKEVRNLIRQFSQDYRDLVSDRYASFESIDGISGRDKEVWESIIVIADLFADLLNTPSSKEGMRALAKKLIVQKRRKELIENREDQILEGTRAYVEQGDAHHLDGLDFYIGEDLCSFIRERWNIGSLSLEAVSRVLHRYEIIKETKRPRVGKKIKNSETETQRSCYLIDKEKLRELTDELLEGGKCS